MHAKICTRQRNDLYCVEWDVKPSIPYHTKDMHNGILHVQGSCGPWKLFLKFSGSGKSWKIRMVVKSHMEITLNGHRKFWHFAPIHISLLFVV